MDGQQKPQLYYWKIRGLGSLINMAFAASGVDYELKEYTPETAQQWFGSDKPGLGATLPNLPFLRDGKVSISEHEPIFRHVLRKYKPELLGRTVDEQAEVDQFLTFWAKANMKIRGWCYSPAAKDATEEARKATLDEFKPQFTSIDKRLESRRFTMGDHLTGADIFLFETYWMMKVMHRPTAESYQNIGRVAKNVEDEEWFKQYRASDRWREQLNGPTAHVNNV